MGLWGLGKGTDVDGCGPEHGDHDTVVGLVHRREGGADPVRDGPSFIDADLLGDLTGKDKLEVDRGHSRGAGGMEEVELRGVRDELMHMHP